MGSHRQRLEHRDLTATTLALASLRRSTPPAWHFRKSKRALSEKNIVLVLVVPRIGATVAHEHRWFACLSLAECVPHWHNCTTRCRARLRMSMISSTEITRATRSIMSWRALYFSPRRQFFIMDDTVSVRRRRFLWSGWGAVKSDPGGKGLLAFVDSGAVDNVLPKSVCTEYLLEATCGVGFNGANGSHIKHYGQRRFRVKTSAGSNMNTTWEVADVRKPLISASRLLERSQSCFGREAEDPVQEWRHNSA